MPFLNGYVLNPTPKETHKLQASAVMGTQVSAVAGLVAICRCNTMGIFCRPLLVSGWTIGILLICLVPEPSAVTLSSLLQLHNRNN